MGFYYLSHPWERRPTTEKQSDHSKRGQSSSYQLKELKRLVKINSTFSIQKVI